VTHRDDDRVSFAQPQRKNVVQPALLVSLHDVTPAHAARLARAEQLLSALGVSEVAYLYVPDFHGRAPAHRDPAFAAWCRSARPFRVQWFLHGYYHLERREPRGAVSGRRSSAIGHWLARTFLTDGEGEFLSVSGRDLQDRLESGIASLTATTGSAPEGFVPPAWLSNADLIPALERLGVRFTENHFQVVDLRARRAVAAPVITWASRSAGRRTSSRLLAAAERRLWTRHPLVRVALHPGDFDHPHLVDSIARTIDALRANRRVIGYAGWQA